MLSPDIAGCIVEEISPQLEGDNDVPWWTGSTTGQFTVSSIYQIVRKKGQKQ